MEREMEIDYQKLELSKLGDLKLSFKVINKIWGRKMFVLGENEWEVIKVCVAKLATVRRLG